MTAKQKSKTRTSKSSSNVKFRWWMAVALVLVVAIVGIAIIRFSRAGIDPAVSNQKAYEAILKDRNYFLNKGEINANAISPLNNPTPPPPKPANWGTTPAQTPPPSKATTPPTPAPQQNNILPKDYQNFQSLLPNIGKAEAYGSQPCSTPDRCNIIAWANSQIGNHASDYYFPYNEPWCSDFVSWIMRQSGIPFWWGVDTNPNGWRVQYSGNIAGPLHFFGNLRDRNYVPEAGDMVFFSWNDGGVPYDHIGIVTYVSGGTMTVVEGNSGPRPNPQTQVEAHTWNRNSSYILAYGRWSR